MTFRRIGTLALGLSACLFATSVGPSLAASASSEAEAALPEPFDFTAGDRPATEAQAAQRAWAAHHRVEVEMTNAIGMKLRFIPPGEYMRGSPPDEEGRLDNERQHQVRLTRGFWMGATEVTRGQFARFVRETGYRTDAEREGWAWQWTETWEQVNGACFRNPGFDQTDDHPVVTVSWNDAKAFVKWLSDKEDQRYRLPTEAEWEYAARAGTTTAFSFGNSSADLHRYGNVADRNTSISRSTTDQDDGHTFTAPVGSYRPNAWGLYDMHGNVWEWCSDWWDAYPNGPVDNPTGPATGSYPVRRGGSWNRYPSSCRSASRYWGTPDYRINLIGFRVALDL